MGGGGGGRVLVLKLGSFSSYEQSSNRDRSTLLSSRLGTVTLTGNIPMLKSYDLVLRCLGGFGFIIWFYGLSGFRVADSVSGCGV